MYKKNEIIIKKKKKSYCTCIKYYELRKFERKNTNKKPPM